MPGAKLVSNCLSSYFPRILIITTTQTEHKTFIQHRQIRDKGVIYWYLQDQDCGRNLCFSQVTIGIEPSRCSASSNSIFVWRDPKRLCIEPPFNPFPLSGL